MSAFIHNYSGAAAMSELDLFTVPLTNAQIDQATYAYYQPLAPLANADTIEFIVPGTGSDYIDLSRTVLEITGKLTKVNGAFYAVADIMNFPVNNFLHSLFKQCDVSLNDHQISKGSQTYPYKAYLEKLLNFSTNTKTSSLSTALWYDDTPGEFEGTVAAAGNVNANEGGKVRGEFTSNSKQLEMLDKLHIDIFNTGKYLLNNVTLRIKLTRSPNTFYLMKTAAAIEGVFTITKAALKIRKVKLTPSVQLAHSSVLTNMKTAKYPIANSEIKTFCITTGANSANIDNIFLGNLPTRVIIGLVDAKAMSGDFTLNPFNFQHFNLNFMALYIDGVMIPSRPYQPDFANNQYLQCYQDFLEGCNKWGNDKSNGINRSAYGKGNTLFILDLTPDLSAASGHFNLLKQGSMRLELRFNVALAQNVNVIIYGESENLIQIDSNRAISLDYNV